jgi:hypothetical protein
MNENNLPVKHILSEVASHSKKSRRKPAKVQGETVISSANIHLLKVEEMVLKVNSMRAHFKRLKYKGSPGLAKNGELNPDIEHVDMDRDAFVKQMYQLIEPNFNITWKNHFTQLCLYVRWLDSKGHSPINSDYFHNELTLNYMEQCNIWVRKGYYKFASWTSAKQMLSAILKELGRNSDAKRLPSIKGGSRDIEPYRGIHVESELKPSAKALFRGFYGLAEHLKKGTKPDIHPMYDEAIINEQAILNNWNTLEKSRRYVSFKNCIKKCFDWRNQLTRLAAMICFMFTGMNTTSLLIMQRKDVRFRQVHGGKYIFESTKERAKNLELDNAFGFGRNARNFIEAWLELSESITGKDKLALLFPFVNKDGIITSFTIASRAPQRSVNKLLLNLGLTPLTPSVLRQTKIDTLLKVTEDIYLVSLASNNSIHTLSRHYSSGLEQDHKRNLSAAFEAQFGLSHGKRIEDAVIDAKYAFNDVLSDYNYRELHADNPNESMTPLGVRCQNNTKGASNLIDKAFKEVVLICKIEKLYVPIFLTALNVNTTN